MLTYPHPLQTKMLSGGSCSLVVEQGHQLDLGGLPLAGKTREQADSFTAREQAWLACPYRPVVGLWPDSPGTRAA